MHTNSIVDFIAVLHDMMLPTNSFTNQADMASS